MKWLTQFSVAFVAAAVFLGACGNGTPAPNVAVGAVASTDAMVAVATTPSQFAVYVCGGSTTVATLTHWFTGSLGNTPSVIDGSADGWTVHATSNPSGWSGSLTAPDATVRSWTASFVDTATLAGLFQVVNQGCRTGIVVSPNPGGTGFSSQGAWCDLSGNFQQVTPISPLALTSGGALQFSVQRPTGTLDLLATRVSLPLP